MKKPVPENCLRVVEFEGVTRNELQYIVPFEKSHIYIARNVYSESWSQVPRRDFHMYSNIKLKPKNPEEPLKVWISDVEADMILKKVGDYYYLPFNDECPYYACCVDFSSGIVLSQPCEAWYDGWRLYDCRFGKLDVYLDGYFYKYSDGLMCFTPARPAKKYSEPNYDYPKNLNTKILSVRDKSRCSLYGPRPGVQDYMSCKDVSVEQSLQRVDHNSRNAEIISIGTIDFIRKVVVGDSSVEVVVCGVNFAELVERVKDLEEKLDLLLRK